MIDVRVLNIQPHPDQATRPGCWAVQFEVSRDDSCWAVQFEVSRDDRIKRTFWRWHTVLELDGLGRYVTPTSLAVRDKKPSVDEILRWFWDDTFSNLHGFSFDTPWSAICAARSTR